MVLGILGPGEAKRSGISPFKGVDVLPTIMYVHVYVQFTKENRFNSLERQKWRIFRLTASPILIFP